MSTGSAKAAVSRGGLLLALRDYRDAWGGIALVNVLSLFAAVLEATALLMIVPLSEAVSSGSQKLTGRIGSLIGQRSPSTLIMVGIALVLGTLVLRIAASYLQVRMKRAVQAREQRRVLDAYISADPQVQQASRTGRLIEVVNWAAGHAGRLGNLTQALRHLTAVIVLLVGAVAVQPSAAVAILLVGGVLFVAFQPLIRLARRASAEATLARIPNTEHVAEVEQVRTEIRSFGAEVWAEKRFAETTDRLMQATARQGIITGVLTPLYQSIALVGIFLVLGIARSSSTLDLPSLGAVALLMLRSLSYGQGFQSSYQSVAENTEVTSRLNESIQLLDDARVVLGTERLESVHSLELRGVTFGYASGGPVLRELSLALSPGDRVGLVGASGVGKTTLAQVLLRLYQPVEGRYLVNGRPATDFEQRSWATQVAFVPQLPRLLHATVHENIAMFRPEISREEVVSAAKRAALDEAIVSLPQGYDTQIGPSSRALSGGQVQRLGIARALAGHPSVVVLDEPTSALDVQTERIVQSTLGSLPEGVILVVIAHRMSTLRVCNRIVVLEGGGISADGSPDEVALRSEYFEATA